MSRKGLPDLVEQAEVGLVEGPGSSGWNPTSRSLSLSPGRKLGPSTEPKAYSRATRCRRQALAMASSWLGASAVVTGTVRSAQYRPPGQLWAAGHDFISASAQRSGALTALLWRPLNVFSAVLSIEERKWSHQLYILAASSDNRWHHRIPAGPAI